MKLQQMHCNQTHHSSVTIIIIITIIANHCSLFTVQRLWEFYFSLIKYAVPIPIRTIPISIPIPIPISSPKLLPFPWESHGNPMGMGIPIPMHTSNSNRILHNDKDYQTLLAGGPNIRTTNPRWRTAAILNKKASIH